MDKRLLILMGLAIAGSAAFFIYRKMYYKHEGIHYTIRPRDAKIRAADSIEYKDETPSASRWKWDFGDGEFSADESGHHTYLIAGTYYLAHTVYGSFGALRKVDTVIVQNSDLVKNTAPGILGSESAIVGSPVSYSAGTTAQSYEWRVEGEAALTGHMQKGTNATYTFTKPGTKTIVLTTKSPDATVRKEIAVADVAAPPVAAKPAPVAAPHPIAMPPAPKHAAQPAAQHPATQHHAEGLEDFEKGVEVKKPH